MFTLTVSDTDHVTFVKFDCIAAQPEGRFVPKARNCCELAGAIALWSAVAVAGEEAAQQRSQTSQRSSWQDNVAPGGLHQTALHDSPQTVALAQRDWPLGPRPCIPSLALVRAMVGAYVDRPCTERRHLSNRPQRTRSNLRGVVTRVGSRFEGQATIAANGCGCVVVHRV